MGRVETLLCGLKCSVFCVLCLVCNLSDTQLRTAACCNPSLSISPKRFFLCCCCVTKNTIIITLEILESLEIVETLWTVETADLTKYDSVSNSVTDNLKARDASASKKA